MGQGVRQAASHGASLLAGWVDFSGEGYAVVPKFSPPGLYGLGDSQGVADCSEETPASQPL